MINPKNMGITKEELDKKAKEVVDNAMQDILENVLPKEWNFRNKVTMGKYFLKQIQNEVRKSLDSDI